MRTSRAGLDLIKEFEGCCLVAYPDVVGVYTIGWGHTKGVSAGDKISMFEAEEFLISDLHQYESYVNQYVKVPITQHQFDALVSFCYNLGPGNLSHSRVLSHTNAKEFQEAADAMLAYDHAGGRRVTGLTRRRHAERKLYLTPDNVEI